MRTFLEDFIKIALVTLAALGFVFAGFWAVQTVNKNNLQKQTPSQKSAPVNIPKATPTSPGVSMQIISGGGAIYKEYTLEASEDWKTEHETSNDITFTTKITKGDYSFLITQTATEGQPCAFVDAPVASNPEFGKRPEYSKFISISGANGEVYRRVDITANPSANAAFFGVCQKNSSENSYFMPTGFGQITYEVPLSNADTAILGELDAMVASLKAK